MIDIKELKDLCNKYPDDFDLGAAIRKLVNDDKFKSFDGANNHFAEIMKKEK